MSVYAKDSTDRFGDDLTELILSYLTLEDKFRFECLSKQWKRCVFEKQFELEVSVMKKQNSLNKLFNSNRHLSRRRLISVLKKCPNLRKVKFCTYEKTDVLSLIGQHCQHIRSWSFYSCDDMTFYQKYGHKVEELVLNGWSVPQSYLEFCPNLKIITVFDDSVILSRDKKFLPKLQRIYSEFYISNENMNQIYTLRYKYSQTLKTLNVNLCDMTEKHLKSCVEYIAGLENLRQLKLTLSSKLIKEPIDDCLSVIGQKCTKLFDLNVKCCIPISQQFFVRFSEFKAIKRLNIQMLCKTVVNASIQSLKHCKQLIHLAIDYDELREDFFINVDSFVPKLQSLRITTDIVFSDEFIDTFELMKNIRSVELMTWNEKYKKSWVFDKCLSEVKSGPNGKAKQWQLRSRLL